MSEAPSGTAPLETADLAAWLAVAAGTLGGFMAFLDVSVVNSAMPVIQGEIGATQSEGTWISTAYLVAEIVVMPLTTWFDRLIGLRRFLLASAVLFTLFSMLCGLAGDLPTMICGRVGQGLAGGSLIPTALTIIATRLPPRQQAIGIALFSCAALLGPIIGPLLGGWITETYSWRYAFYINAPICGVLVALLLLGLPAKKGDWHELARADWAGIFGMALALGSITILLEEGHREQWFDSALIRTLAAGCVVGCVAVGWGQWRSARPIVSLALLRNPALTATIVLSLMAGALMFTSLFSVPQFLAAIAGYNAWQSGTVIAISGGSAILAAALYPLVIARVDVRLLVGAAFLVQALACWQASHLTAASDGTAFALSQMLLGVGLTLAVVPLQQVNVSVVRLEEAGEASSLFVVARNLGASIGLAAVASFQDQRLEFHHWRLHSAIAASDPAMQAQVAADAAAHGGGADGLAAALTLVDSHVMMDALVMSFNDVFLALAVATLLASPLVLLLRPIDPARAMGAAH